MNVQTKRWIRQISVFFVLLLITAALFSCANGEPGAPGEKGADGKTPVFKIESSELYVSYDDGLTWSTLGSIAGKDGVDGKDGIDGKDGADGKDGVDGKDGIDGEDGADGKDGRGILHAEVIDGCLWLTYSDAPDHPINVGRVDEENDALLALLESAFSIRENAFVCYRETLSRPSWCYTTSTFSGWAGGIGRPETVEAIAIRVRARDEAITQIRFFLNRNDKNGETLFSETLEVNVPAGEEAEIVWRLPEALEGNTEFLYLAYQCNRLCDLYSAVGTQALIPENECRAVMSYMTNGRLTDSSANMVDVVGKPCYYLYARIGSVRDILVPREDAFVQEKRINVFLPEEYDLAVGDQFQLFYRGVVQAVDPYGYSISATCAKGASYPRYFEWTPTAEDVGRHRLVITVRDDAGNLLGTDTTVLNVCTPKAEEEVQNVLCIGDSLTAGGVWPREAYRRFASTGGTPEGLGLSYLNFIGTCHAEVDGQTVGYEGYGGWTWQRFCGEASPFYDAELGDISFASYCERNGFADIDVVYFLLTWNGQGTPYKTSFPLDSGHLLYAQKLLDTLHREYPNAEVRCLGLQMPSQNGGMGASYGASGGYSDAYGMLVTAMHYNAALEALCRTEKYASFVKYVDVAGQFDTDYNMPVKDSPVNDRNTATEIVGTNGVHPSTAGYYQIADAVFRSLCEIFAQ